MENTRFNGSHARNKRQAHSSMIFRLPCLFILSSLVLAGLQQSAAGEVRDKSGETLLGSYSTSDNYSERNGISISISVHREEGGYRLNFQGTSTGRAGHGHAPEGGGHGQIKDGVFLFEFQDSFSNRGSGTFRRAGKHYLLHIDISHLAEPRIIVFYDDIPLQRD